VTGTWRPPARLSTASSRSPTDELPYCAACGKQVACERWYLCPDVCMPALLAEARSWLAREKRHNERLARAGEDGEDETELGAESESRAEALLLTLRQRAAEPTTPETT
jgi:hypothetical protein